MTSGRDLLALYREETRGTRVHTAVRWRTCPFRAAAEPIPRAGRILELGCGHGLFSTWLSLDSPDRSIFGTDVDGAKIRTAERVATRAGTALRFESSEPGDFPPGPWDAVAIIDVLYLIDAAGEEALLRTAAAALAPGGVLVVKEMATSPAWKCRLMRFQEHLSVRVLRITAGDELTFVEPSRLAGWMTDAGLVVEQRRIDRRYLHPHHLVVGRKPR